VTQRPTRSPLPALLGREVSLLLSSGLRLRGVLSALHPAGLTILARLGHHTAPEALYVPTAGISYVALPEGAPAPNEAL
jgi:hypothetical protein